jgi:hypothetical protein
MASVGGAFSVDNGNHFVSILVLFDMCIAPLLTFLYIVPPWIWQG